MNEFKTYHPIVNITYFIFVIGFSCFFMHPICLFVSLVSGFTYMIMLKGKKTIKMNLIYMLPMILLMAIINPMFNHEGATIIEYLPSGNPLTLESIIFGLCTAVMIVSVICHFSCYNEVMTSDKIVYLFGRIIPAMSLIFSMTIRFIPKFFSQLNVVRNAQKCSGKDITNGNIIKRAKHGLDILSIMITWSLENAIETADSMKSRGYGIPGRTAYSIFTFDKRDKKLFVCIIILSIYTFMGYLMGEMHSEFFPSMKFSDFSIYGVSTFFAYFLLCISPVIIEIWEVIKWKNLKSKM